MIFGLLPKLKLLTMIWKVLFDVEKQQLELTMHPSWCSVFLGKMLCAPVPETYMLSLAFWLRKSISKYSGASTIFYHQLNLQNRRTAYAFITDSNLLISSSLARICIINTTAPVRFVTFQADSVQLCLILTVTYTHSYACTTGYDLLFLFKWRTIIFPYLKEMNKSPIRKACYFKACYFFCLTVSDIFFFAVVLWENCNRNIIMVIMLWGRFCFMREVLLHEGEVYSCAETWIHFRSWLRI